MKAKESGFTLIEIIVVAGIILTMSGISLVVYSKGQGRFALQRSASKLARDLRATQELSMSAKIYNCENLKGYGISLKTDFPRQYIIGAVCGTSFAPIETINLEKGVKITTPALLNVYFYPPDPVIDLAGANEAQIILSLEANPNISKTIKINKAGLIYAE